MRYSTIEHNGGNFIYIDLSNLVDEKEQLDLLYKLEGHLKIVSTPQNLLFNYHKCRPKLKYIEEIRRCNIAYKDKLGNIGGLGINSIFLTMLLSIHLKITGTKNWKLFDSFEEAKEFFKTNTISTSTNKSYDNNAEQSQ